MRTSGTVHELLLQGAVCMYVSMCVCMHYALYIHMYCVYVLAMHALRAGY